MSKRNLYVTTYKCNKEHVDLYTCILDEQYLLTKAHPI